MRMCETEKRREGHDMDKSENTSFLPSVWPPVLRYSD